MNNTFPYFAIIRRAVAPVLPVLIVLFVAVGTPGCMPMLHMGAGSQGAQHDQHAQQVDPDRWIREELYFGSQIPISKGGGVVTDAEWQEFLDNEITPRFPKGLTTLTANGQYRYADGTLGKEKTRIVILYYFSKPDDNDKVLEEIMVLYKTRFHQESVMRVTNFVDVRVR